MKALAFISCAEPAGERSSWKILTWTGRPKKQKRPAKNERIYLSVGSGHKNWHLLLLRLKKSPGHRPQLDAGSDISFFPAVKFSIFPRICVVQLKFFIAVCSFRLDYVVIEFRQMRRPTSIQFHGRIALPVIRAESQASADWLQIARIDYNKTEPSNERGSFRVSIGHPNRAGMSTNVNICGTNPPSWLVKQLPFWHLIRPVKLPCCQFFKFRN